MCDIPGSIHSTLKKINNNEKQHNRFDFSELQKVNLFSS